MDIFPDIVPIIDLYFKSISFSLEKKGPLDHSL